MTDTITLTGFVATEPNHRLTDKGVPITDFRLGSNHRRFDKDKQEWVDTYTNWYTISTFRGLALNSMISIKKGQRVIVTGKLRLKSWENSTKSGTAVEVDADSVGHDLTFGTSAFTRTAPSRSDSFGRDTAPDMDGPAPDDETPTEEAEFAPADAASGALVPDANPESDGPAADQYADAGASPRTPF
ncbi:single-stranded DNA-binding protein [Salinibacterium sp. ZJ450]|uniref:single-stranded DNA-binding protein n=1 Tax=Salinibacterium sp. ZJ450 TaxID=2708338 RepID=UPI0014231099|nr:single-stranded DNA-binding protein [Salinibacterium sp. ZJ450]